MDTQDVTGTPIRSRSLPRFIYADETWGTELPASESTLVPNAGRPTQVTRQIFTGLIGETSPDMPKSTAMLVAVHEPAGLSEKFSFAGEEAVDFHVLFFDVFDFSRTSDWGMEDDSLASQWMATGLNLVEQCLSCLRSSCFFGEMKPIAWKMLKDFPELLQALWVRGFLSGDIEWYRFQLDSFTTLPLYRVSNVGIQDTTEGLRWDYPIYAGAPIVSVLTATLSGSIQLGDECVPMKFSGDIKCGATAPETLSVHYMIFGGRGLTVRENLWTLTNCNI